jgi:hypothetical protein
MAEAGEGDAGAGDAGGASEEGKTVLGAQGEGDGTGEDKGSSGDKPGEGESGDKSGEGDGTGDQQTAEVPGEFSDFEIPEGSVVNEEWLGKFTNNEAVKKLTQSDAQSLLGMVGEWQAEQGAQAVETHNKMVEGWANEWNASPLVKELGANEANRLAVLASQSLFPDLVANADGETLWNSTGLGSHPAVLSGLANLARLLNLSEATSEGGGTPPQAQSKKSAAHILFPSMVPDAN